jgi:hypothetical protein
MTLQLLFEVVFINVWLSAKYIDILGVSEGSIVWFPDELQLLTFMISCAHKTSEMLRKIINSTGNTIINHFK